MGKRKSIQQALLGNLDSCMQSNETRTHPHTMHKNKLGGTMKISTDDGFSILINIMKRDFTD